MASLAETRFIERLQFFDGQRLFASDMQGIEAFNREMRWLHNQSLHQPGIGSGFAVYGRQGDREVTIKPGYAVDDQGREIVLMQDQVESVPPVAAEDDGQSVFYDLTVSYPADSDLEEAETREGICLPRGVVRLREEPVFCWNRLERDAFGNLHARNPAVIDDIKIGRKIVLARAEVYNCQLKQDLSIAQRRSARPPKQPYITCAEVKPVWSPWQIDVPQPQLNLAFGRLKTAINLQQNNFNIGLTAEIDTSGAGFATTPCYSARIEGARPGMLSTQSGTVVDLGNMFIDASIYVQDSRPAGFTVYVLVLPPTDQLQKAFDQVVNWANQKWTVVWMGIEG